METNVDWNVYEGNIYAYINEQPMGCVMPAAMGWVAYRFDRSGIEAVIVPVAQGLRSLEGAQNAVRDALHAVAA